MNWADFILIFVCCVGVGIYLAWRCSNCRIFWAIVDIIWISCGIVAIGFAAVEYTRAVTKVNQDIATHHLARIKDSIRIESYGINKLYCSNHASIEKDRTEFKRYCETINDVMFYTSLSRMTPTDATRLLTEIEKNISTIKPPTINNNLILDLNTYSKFYESKKDNIETDITQPQFHSLIKLIFYVGLIIPLSFRIGRSCAEFFREWRSR